MSKIGLVLMTALPPTIGHKNLINFAQNFLSSTDSYKLHVLLNSRSFEPLLGDIRYNALKSVFQNDVNVIIHHCADDNVPQTPADHNEFWNIWKNIISTETSVNKFDFVFASETYGIILSEILNATFVPFDIKREITRISGTVVREDPLSQFKFMLPGIQQHYKKTVTFFGPESVGKTTITKNIFAGATFDCVRVPEWARGYLETVGPEVTDEKMLNIVHGQYAIQKLANNVKHCPFVLQDTDLLSTLGYYKLWSGKWPDICEGLFRASKSDLYILMNDQIPFEPDVLRYGINKRESDNKFWIELLKQFDCNYYEVLALNPTEQILELEVVLTTHFYKKCKLPGFIRE
jgi:HTH-type transcriptional regulator, transcriptional repressor of NAD biosynthesis genes